MTRIYGCHFSRAANPSKSFTSPRTVQRLFTYSPNRPLRGQARTFHAITSNAGYWGQGLPFSYPVEVLQHLQLTGPSELYNLAVTINYKVFKPP
ncbi:hypothetical protein [Paenibacillus gansuensis]|uniref:Uncharacterized protein n=1 Tax=Paenibacillus gansuensis TaxID=306542 RepID=A0ABW5PGY5_9BACL